MLAITLDEVYSLKDLSYQFRNWTSIELAKPVWEDEPKLRQGEDDLSLSEYSGGRRGQSDGHGSVEAVDMDLVDTYGYWDQSLDIMPALSRSVHTGCLK